MPTIVLSKSSNDRSRFGLSSKGDLLNLTVPATYGALETAADGSIEIGADNNDYIIRFLSTLDLMGKYSDTGIAYSLRKGNQPNTVDSAIWLLNDYLTNGAPHKFRYVSKPGSSGHIDWKRTIQRESPMLIDGQPTFFRLHSIEKNPFENDLVFAYKLCVNRAITLVGFLHGIFMPSFDIDEPDDIGLEYFLEAIRHEIDSTYRDSDLQRLEHMLNILSPNDLFSPAGIERYCVDEYNPIFESLVYEVFSNRDAEDYYPRARYDLIDDMPYEQLRPMRPDCIMVVGDYYLVIDAKFYQYGYGGNNVLPRTTEIAKQITYAENLQNMGIDRDRIINVFLLPMASECAPIKKIGSTRCSWCNEGYSFIQVLQIDLKTLIDAWYSGEKGRLKEELVTQLGLH